MTSCADYQDIGALSGQKTIIVRSNLPMVVECQFADGEARLTIMHRIYIAFTLNYNLTFAEYEDGFGVPFIEGFVGLRALRFFTKDAPVELLVHSTYGGAQTDESSRYSSFSVAGSGDCYRLSVAGYSGSWIPGTDDSQDLLTNSNPGWNLNGMCFSTSDQDNDLSADHCAAAVGGGWWYNNCAGGAPTAPRPDDYAVCMVADVCSSWFFFDRYFFSNKLQIIY